MADELSPEQRVGQQIEQLHEVLTDRLRTGLMDTMFKLDAFKAAFDAKCPCGEPAVLCSEHAPEATDRLERVMFPNAEAGDSPTESETPGEG